MHLTTQRERSGKLLGEAMNGVKLQGVRTQATLSLPPSFPHHTSEPSSTQTHDSNFSTQRVVTHVVRERRRSYRVRTHTHS